MKNYKKFNLKVLFGSFIGIILFSLFSCDDTLDTRASGIEKGIRLDVNSKDVNGEDIEDLSSLEIFDTREFSIADSDENLLIREDGTPAVTWYFEAARFEIINEEGEVIGTPADFLGSEDNFYTSISGIETVTVRAIALTEFTGTDLQQISRSYVEIITDDNGELDLETRVNLLKVFPPVEPELNIIPGPSPEVDLKAEVPFQVGPNQPVTLSPKFGRGEPFGSSLTIFGDRILYAIPSKAKVLTNLSERGNIKAVEYNDSLFLPNLDNPIVQKIKNNPSDFQLFIGNGGGFINGRSNLTFSVEEVGFYPIYFAYSRKLPLTNFVAPSVTPEIYDNILEITPFITLKGKRFNDVGTKVILEAAPGEDFSALPADAVNDFKLDLGDGVDYTLELTQIDDTTLEFDIEGISDYYVYTQRPNVAKLIYTETSGKIVSSSGKFFGDGEYIISNPDVVYNQGSDRGTFFVMDGETADFTASVVQQNDSNGVTVETIDGGLAPGGRALRIAVNSGRGVFRVHVENFLNFEITEGKRVEYTYRARIISNGVPDLEVREIRATLTSRETSSDFSNSQQRNSTSLPWGVVGVSKIAVDGDWSTVFKAAAEQGPFTSKNIGDGEQSILQLRIFIRDFEPSPGKPFYIEFDNFVFRTVN